jgi:hypothetical protein
VVVSVRYEGNPYEEDVVKGRLPELKVSSYFSLSSTQPTLLQSPSREACSLYLSTFENCATIKYKGRMVWPVITSL